MEHNTIIMNPISEASFDKVLKNNNNSCYMHGYLNGCCAGMLIGVGATLATSIIAGAIFKLGKVEGKRQAKNTFEIDIDEEEKEE